MKKFLFAIMLIAFSNFSFGKSGNLNVNGWSYVYDMADGKFNYQNALKIGDDGGVLSLLLSKGKEEIMISSEKGILCEQVCKILLFVDNDGPEEFSGYYRDGIIIKPANDIFNRIMKANHVEATVTLAGGKSTTFTFDTSKNPLVLNN